MKIDNATVLVTGANRGIGLAFAKEALARGARKVYAAARDPASITLPGVTPIRLDVTSADAVAEAGEHAIPSPEAWWSAVLGSGYRGTLEQLDNAARERVRDSNLAYIRASGVRSVEANVVFAIARKD